MLRDLSTCAIRLSRQKEYTQAEALFQQILMQSQKELGEEHPNTMQSQLNLASCYMDQGNLSKPRVSFSKFSTGANECILENYSRAILTSAISRRQDTAASLSVLYAAICKHGCPEAIVSDHGKVFLSQEATKIYTFFGICKEEIELRQSKPVPTVRARDARRSLSSFSRSHCFAKAMVLAGKLVHMASLLCLAVQVRILPRPSLGGFTYRVPDIFSQCFWLTRTLCESKESQRKTLKMVPS